MMLHTVGLNLAPNMSGMESERAITKGGPLVKRILQSYIVDSADSLAGPNMASILSSENRNKKIGSKPPVLDKLQSPSDQGLSKHLSRKRVESCPSVDTQSPRDIPDLDSLSLKSECDVIYTDLEGEQIAGFTVGGEIRLCLLRILTQVLYDFSREQISSVCDELHINLASCSDAQLSALKRYGVLPGNSTRCGLITKTDSERLCRTLLHCNAALTAERPVVATGRNAVMVAHECFGGCRGVIALDLYKRAEDQCIQCAECREMFAPAQFVAHCHDDPEHRACHWGFDPSHWRSYLMLSEDVEVRDYERLMGVLDDFKLRFQISGADVKIETGEDVDDSVPVKKARLHSSVSCSAAVPLSANHSLAAASASAATSASANHSSAAPVSANHSSSRQQQLSGIARAASVVRKLRESLSSQSDADSVRGGERKFSDSTALPVYLYTGEPVLTQHSLDKYINQHNDKYRVDPGYQPNVSLDPKPYQDLRNKYPDLVHSNDPAQKSLSAFTDPFKGQRLSGFSEKSLSADDDVFSGAEDDDDDDDNDDDDDDDELEKLVEVKTENIALSPDDTTATPQPSLPTLGSDDFLASLKRDRKTKFDLLVEVLEGVGGPGGAQGAQGPRDPLDRFMELQKKEKEVIAELMKGITTNEKDLDYASRQLNEKQSRWKSERQAHEQEMTRVRQENATRMREVTLERYELLKKIECLSNGSNNTQLAVMAAQYKEEADSLRLRLSEVELSNSRLQQEINELRATIEKSAHDKRLLALAPAATSAPLEWFTAPGGTAWVVAMKKE